MPKTHYQVIGKHVHEISKGREYFLNWASQMGFKHIGDQESDGSCDDLQGQPIFSSLIGPIYSGTNEEGVPVVTYKITAS